MKMLLTRPALLALVLATAAMNAACIESETSTTIVIEPDGSGRWIALQRDIHAVADTPDDRLREEQEFMSNVLSGRHDEAVAFRALGATDVKTQVLSAEWPFALQTEARFANLADVLSRFFDALGVDARTTLVRNADGMIFKAVVNTDDRQAGAANREGDDTETRRAMQSLFGERGPVVFIRHGQFLSATGFTVSDDGRMAKLDDLDDKEPTVTLTLSWTGKEASTSKPKR